MLKFITGIVPKPTVGTPNPDVWTSQNALALTWLLNSLVATIRHNFLFLETPHQVWAAVAQTYSQKWNVAQAFELRRRRRGFDQNNRSLAEYYSELSGVWQEIGYL